MPAGKTALGLDKDPVDAAKFDIDAWLKKATVPQRTVTVYADRATADQAVVLQGRIEAVQARIEAEEDPATSTLR